MVVKRTSTKGTPLATVERKILGKSGMKEVDAMVAAVKRINAAHGRLWEQWVIIGHGLAAGRRVVQEDNPGIVIPSGQYSRKMSEWLALHKITDKMISPAERAALLNIMDNFPEVDAWRKGLTAPDEQRRVTHPERVWQKWNALHGSPKKRKKKTKMRAENPEADSEAVQELTDDLQAAQDRIEQLEQETEGTWLKGKLNAQRVFRKVKRDLHNMPLPEYLQLGELIVEDAKARLGQNGGAEEDDQPSA